MRVGPLPTKQAETVVNIISDALANLGQAFNLILQPMQILYLHGLQD